MAKSCSLRLWKVERPAVRRLGRLNADGTRDTGFNPENNPGYAGEALAIQADGKIVVAGSVRLNPDGTRDSSFNPPEQYYGGRY